MVETVEAATRDDVGGLIELLNARPPAFWMRKVGDEDLRKFLRSAVQSPRCVLLAARAPGEAVPAGYIFAVLDTRRFWSGFVLRNPALALKISVHRARRLRERRREIDGRAGGDAAALPPFAWAPSARSAARVIGLFVRPEHRHKGVALSLYSGLFDALKAKGVALVEEYMGPDYAQYAGTFPEASGWRLQQCRCRGYKLAKEL